ncbi:MAG: hypothetical protein COA69_06430 [Robiginitomaculum sp.]|nr:MAG: hypothetical protein COA69_06430 [Robiginitomaculum sp.]
MRKLICASTLVLSSLTTGISAFADDMSACEIVLMRSLSVSETQASTGSEQEPVLASFLPADKFVFSVFDAQPGHLEEVDGKPIRALMCTRAHVIPTEFDVKLIRTDIPFHISQDYDSAQSGLLSIRKENGHYVHTYSGPELSDDDKAVLKLRMNKLNGEDE